MKKSTTLSTLLLALALVACGKQENVKISASTTPVVETALPAAYTDYIKSSQFPTGQLKDSKRLEGIKQALSTLLKKDAAQIIIANKATFFDDGRVNLIVIDKDKKPMVATEYSYYNDVWNKSKELKVKANLPLNDLTMPLSELDFAAAQQALLKTAEKAASIPNSKLHSYVNFILFSKDFKRGWVGILKAGTTVHEIRFDQQLNYIDTHSFEPTELSL